MNTVIAATLAEHDAYSVAYNQRIERFPDEGHERRLAHAAGFTEGWQAALDALGVQLVSSEDIQAMDEAAKDSSPAPGLVKMLRDARA